MQQNSYSNLKYFRINVKSAQRSALFQVHEFTKWGIIILDKMTSIVNNVTDLKPVSN